MPVNEKFRQYFGPTIPVCEDHVVVVRLKTARHCLDVDAKSLVVVAFVQRFVAMGRGSLRNRWDVRFFTIGTCFFAATILIDVSITETN